MEDMNDSKRRLLKHLPKIDDIMLILGSKNAFEKAPRELVKSACRSVVEDMRQGIILAKEEVADRRMPKTDQVADRVMDVINGFHSYHLRRVVNATGVVLHTNLGRAPLCAEAMTRIMAVATGYSNLEYDLEKGERGLRYQHVQTLLCALSGAEDALVVNNNAAAVLLAINTLADGKEAIVSRGELVEIGGEFRIHEVMEKSGARLHEVGTTNRTRISDYERAIGPETGVILKVHTSNFRIVGFTEQAESEELAALGRKHGIPVLHDLGSGCFVELDRYGLLREPTVRDALATGVDVVTFSGDKLLGGPQAGIILGRRDMLQRIKKNPLTRALRIDKLTLAALEGTMVTYLQPHGLIDRIAVLKMLTEPLAGVTKRAKELLALLKKEHLDGIKVSLQPGFSLPGGGALPSQEIPSALISLVSLHMSPSRLAERLRRLEVPVIVRIAENEILIDLRTIREEEYTYIKDGLKKIMAS